MDKVLVTGGSGFLGSNLVKRLVHEGYTVRVLDNNFRGRKCKLKEYLNEIEFLDGDIRNFELVDRSCKNMDVVIHLAFINGTKFFYQIPEQVLDIGVKGALNTLEASIKNGIKKYILASSSEIYQEPTTIPTLETERAIIPDITNPRYSYAGGKIISELLTIHYCRKHSLPYIIFRPHNIYGPDMGFEHVIPEFILRMKELSNNFSNPSIHFPIQGTGNETRSFCYIDDFIDGLILLLKSDNMNEIYNIGNDQEEIKITNLAYTIAELLNIEINIVNRELSSGSTPRRCPNIQKLRELGYNPRISLKEGLINTMAWYLA